MKIGTKSLLFGSHQFLLHPWFVAAAWWKLYGFPWDPRLWVAFFVHDLGYIGKPNMDGPEGEDHVLLGAWIMGVLFGRKWRYFCACHSRFWARNYCLDPSRLCYADKLAISLTPAWLYLPLARASGEIHEYIERHRDLNGKYGDSQCSTQSHEVWFRDLQIFMRRWVEERV